jgi:hypothetical protein
MRIFLISSRRWLSLVMLFSAVFSVLAFYTNVQTKLTAADVAVFTAMGLSKPSGSLSFEQQIALIRQVQAEVFARAPMGDGIPEYEAREPADLMRHGKGLCFDRSRTLDKALNYLGFETRHVYLLYREKKSFLIALTSYRQPSHAVTEVKTSMGWMLVDSNTQWLALARDGAPVNADGVWHRFAEFDNAPEYFNSPSWAIRGMYSRKGQFYKPYLPFPQMNWPDFLGWMVKD